MCGIFGGIKNVKPNTLKILGICNEDRGTDASGIFDIDGYIKDELSFRDLILADTEELIKNFKGYLVGHTRFATRGEKTARNAHPFEFGNIIGVHNGQIRNFDDLKRKYKQKFLECDSEIIFYLLNKKGIEGLKELIGYYAIVWSDRRTPDKLYFLQHECTLAYCREKKEYLYFSSDSKDLEIALGFGVKIIKAREDVIYTIDINSLKITETKIKGLQRDWGYSSISTIPSYKTKDDYKKIACPTEYYEEDYYRELDEQYDRDIQKFRTEMDKKFDRNEVACPYCNEIVPIKDALKQKCPFCHTFLTGMIYECYHCENPVLIECVDEDEKCPYCELHMNLDDKYLMSDISILNTEYK